MKVEIRKKAFVPLILASVEVFKRETIGLILGRCEDGKTIIKTCLPVQESKRSFNSVDFHKKRLTRILEVVERFYPKTGYELLGYFHSHPEFGETKYKPKPSKEDKDWFREEKEGLFFVIVAIRTKKRKQKWHMSRKQKILSGTIGAYHFDISVYFRKGKRFLRAKIAFPEFLKEAKTNKKGFVREVSFLQTA